MSPSYNAPKRPKRGGGSASGAAAHCGSSRLEGETLTDSSDAKRENEALRERISTLSAAILRISATLDLDTVLAEVVESARTLAGARYGSSLRSTTRGRPPANPCSPASRRPARGVRHAVCSIQVIADIMTSLERRCRTSPTRSSTG